MEASNLIKESCQNLLGLRDGFSNSSNTKLNNQDVRTLLDLTNYLRLISGLEIKASLSMTEAPNLIKDFLKEFDHLENDQSKLEDEVLCTLKRTQAENNLLKLPAINAMLIVFRFLDVLNLVNDSEVTDFEIDTEILSDLKELEVEILTSMKNAFARHGYSMKNFLDRFQDNKLWQKSLNRKEFLIAKLNSI